MTVLRRLAAMQDKLSRAGFILAVLYSHYVFLRCLKAWELQRGEAAPRAKR